MVTVGPQYESVKPFTPWNVEVAITKIMNKASAGNDQLISETQNTGNSNILQY